MMLLFISLCLKTNDERLDKKLVESLLQAEFMFIFFFFILLSTLVKRTIFDKVVRPIDDTHIPNSGLLKYAL